VGGLGSGGHNNKGRRLVEAQYRLDASEMKRRGAFVTGYDAHMTWRGSDGASGPSVRVLGGPDAIRLEYSVKQPDGSWQRREEYIPLLSSPRNYGGAQTYFGCPKCGTRVKRLYIGSARFLCRHCLNLVFASSQERSMDRALRRMRKLRRRIGANTGLEEPIGPKPKGMHQRTYDRLFNQILDAEAEVNDGFIRMLARLQRFESTGRDGTRNATNSFWS
jgi:hypothetical protein